MPLQFEWDPAKATANFAKHGVTFEEARDAFDDPLSRTIDDPAHSLDESRLWTMGLSRTGRLLVVIHVDRGANIRIIGARCATRRKRQDYEEDPT